MGRVAFSVEHSPYGLPLRVNHPADRNAGAADHCQDCARRELYEETGVRAGIEDAWWARVEPWRDPGDPELYAGVGFLARHPGGEIEPESAAHDAFMWATETEWRSLRTWYTARESDVLWTAIKEMQR